MAVLMSSRIRDRVEYTYRRIARNVDVHDAELLRHCPVDILCDAIDLRALGVSTQEHGIVKLHDQSLTTQALPGSKVLVKGSGCAMISGLQQSIFSLNHPGDRNRLTDRG